MYACGTCKGSFATPKTDGPKRSCPNCAASTVFNLDSHIHQFVREMETDVNTSANRSQDFEAGKAWVIRRAFIRANMELPSGR